MVQRNFDVGDEAHADRNLLFAHHSRSVTVLVMATGALEVLQLHDLVLENSVTNFVCSHFSELVYSCNGIIFDVETNFN